MNRGRHVDRGGRRTAHRPAVLRRLVLAAGAALPIATFLVLRNVLHSDADALAVSAAIPLAWTLTGDGARRRLSPVAVLAVLVLVIALLVSLASGGSALPLKLRRGMITGPLGLACLVSVALRRPLLPVLVDLLPSRGPTAAVGRIAALRAELAGDAAPMLTAIVGVGLLTDAAVQVTLALTVSTTVFVSISGLARLAVTAVAVGACAVGLRVRRSRRGPAAAAGEREGAPVVPAGAPRP
ncbi:MAG TPA: hypothetical protein VFN87_14750 [Solirubrobacteraceae bacterium]|nr:hypothetical protein [Solirubrobacteraceae bacterium]